MPKIVDADQRRSRLVTAAFRLIETGGVEALSFRNLAAESDLNVGSVRNSFPTQRDLLAAAAEEVGRRMGERLAHHDLSGAPGSHDVDSAVALLGELLPLDRTRTTENVVLGEFMMAARTHPAFRSVTARMAGDMHDVVRAAVAGLGLDGDDAERTATTVKTLMVGMTFDACTGHGEPLPADMQSMLAELLRTSLP